VGGWLVAISKVKIPVKKKTGIFNNTIIGESNERRKEKRQRFNDRKDR
jgi:hypothetical protein